MIEADFAHAVKGVAVNGFGSGSVAVPESLDALEGGAYFLTTPWDLCPDCDLTDVKHDFASIASFLEGR